jgi:hypothetical protein
MKRKVLIVLTIAIFMGCKSADNPSYIGIDYGSYDLSMITFSENIDTLFSKIPHIIIPKTEDKYDPKTGVTTVIDTNAYVIRVEDFAKSKALFHFGKLEYSTPNIFVYLTKNKDFVAFGFSQHDCIYLESFVNFLNNKYKGFKVKDKQSEGYYNIKWETKNDIIVLTYRFEILKNQGNYYNFAIINKKEMNKIPSDVLDLTGINSF